MDSKESVAVKYCADYEKPNLISRVRELFRLLEKDGEPLFRPGEQVLVKPNLLLGRRDDFCSITHPAVIEAVLEILLDYHTKPFICEMPGIMSLHQVCSVSGLDKIAKRLSVEVIEPGEFRHVRRDDNISHKTFPLPVELSEADAVVNLPKLKTHTLMNLTLGVKNTFGLMRPSYRSEWHLRAGRDTGVFSEMLYDLHCSVAPRVTLLDGIIGMEGDGPASGRPRNFGLLAASTSAVALDTVVAHMGKIDPLTIPLQKYVTEQAVPGSKFEEICILGDGIKPMGPIEVPRTYRGHHSRLELFLKGIFPYVKPLLLHKPVINTKRCNMCLACKKICPVGAVRERDGHLNIDQRICIRCFCCHEMCPSNAISLKATPVRRLFDLVMSLKLKSQRYGPE